jgi:hypothetical protein
MDEPSTTYVAKCYWPGLTEQELARAMMRAGEQAAATSRQATPVGYLGAIFFPDDELLLCLFRAASRAAVVGLSEKAGLPCERVMHSLWLAGPAQPITANEDTT